MSVKASESDQNNWQLPDDLIAMDDPLLSCLVILTRMQNRPISTDSLRAGLPLVDNRLTPQLFLRAAKRAGLAAKIIKRPLKKISSLVLPAVLLLKNEQACVLLDINQNAGTARIMQPETGDGEQEISLQELKKHYIGYSIFIKPEHHFDERAPDLIDARTPHWFWGTLFRSWRIYRDVLVASFLINLFALASPLFIMNVYDRVVPNNAVETLWVLGIGVAIVFAFDLMMRALRSYFIDIAGKKSDVTLSSIIFERVIGLKMEARPESVGGFANNLSEFENIRNFITSFTVSTLVDLPFVILFLFVISLIGGPVVIIPLIGIPLVILYGLIIQIPLRRAVQNTFRGSAQKNAALIEGLINAERVKTLGAEGVLQGKWEQAVAYIAKWSVRSRMLSSSAVNVAVFLQQVATVGVVVYGVYLISDGSISVGGLIACVILTGRTMAPMAQVANLAAHYHQSWAALKTLDRLMSLPVERSAEKNYIHREKLDGMIEFENVNFSYPGKPLEVLKDVSFRIMPWERVGIIGRTGSGKSTIEKLILGLYEPTSGSVRVDGVDVHQIDPADLRRNIGYVPQDVSLFYGTVRDNIVYGVPYVDDQIMLKAAVLSGVNEMIESHPMGYDMPVGERGERLSGGQRQKVCVARSLLLNPPILLLDEPSNSLDHASEERLKDNLSDIFKEKTLLLVTHKASLLEIVDRLIVIEGGKIAADGPKEKVIELLKQGKVHAR